MFSKKTRVIIVSTLLIAALALALRGRIIWDEITQWITVQSLPLISSQSEPLEQSKQLPEQPSPVYDTPEITITSSAIAPSDEIQVIPTPEEITAVFEQKKNEFTTSAPKKTRVARRRRKKEVEKIQEIESQKQPTVVIAEEKQNEPTATQQTSTVTAAEVMHTKVAEIETPSRLAPKKTIRICNKIDAKALGVKHWTGTYSPTKLEISLNNVPFVIVGDNPIALETLQEIPCADNRITVYYHYEFLNGMRKGSDTVFYTCTDATQLEMRFSWDTPWHVELGGAQRIE